MSNGETKPLWQDQARSWSQPSRTNEDRLEVVRQFLEEKIPAKELAKRYNLSSPQVIYQWVGRCFEDINAAEAARDSESGQSLGRALASQDDVRRENEQLKKALQVEKLRSEAYRYVIETAEKQFGIPIRKKSGTKQ
jgi:transposase-like protein